MAMVGFHLNWWREEVVKEPEIMVEWDNQELSHLDRAARGSQANIHLNIRNLWTVEVAWANNMVSAPWVHTLEITCMVGCQEECIKANNQIIRYLNCNSWWCSSSKTKTCQVWTDGRCLRTRRANQAISVNSNSQQQSLDLVLCRQLKYWPSHINRPVDLNKLLCKHRSHRLLEESMTLVICWTRVCMVDLLDIWDLNSLQVLTKAINQVRIPINITHFNNIKAKICKIHTIQLWLVLKFSNIWEWHKISNIKESSPEVSCSTIQVNSGWMGVAQHKINTSTITWREVKLLETKDFIGKASNRWMATSWPTCRWPLRLVDLQWRNRWSSR